MYRGCHRQISASSSLCPPRGHGLRVGVSWRQMNSFERGNVSPRINYDIHISDEVRYFEQLANYYGMGFYYIDIIFITFLILLQLLKCL